MSDSSQNRNPEIQYPMDPPPPRNDLGGNETPRHAVVHLVHIADDVSVPPTEEDITKAIAAEDRAIADQANGRDPTLAEEREARAQRAWSNSTWVTGDLDSNQNDSNSGGTPTSTFPETELAGSERER